jgi:hypothetical protein
MITAKKFAQAIALAALFGTALYVVVYFMAGHGEAFEFIEQQIRSSRAIRSQVGEIKEIRPSVLGSYDHKTVGSDERVSMTIHVTGAVRAIELDVKASRTDGTWVLETELDPVKQEPNGPK